MKTIHTHQIHRCKECLEILEDFNDGFDHRIINNEFTDCRLTLDNSLCLDINKRKNRRFDCIYGEVEMNEVYKAKE